MTDALKVSPGDSIVPGTQYVCIKCLLIWANGFLQFKSKQ